jgi:hypothetical protein
MTDDLGITLLAAFQLAENSRKAAGFAPRKAPHEYFYKRRAKDGSKRFRGPSAYKITLWLRPWTYADAMVEKANSNNPGQSLTKFLQSKLEDGLSHHATRPTPKPDNVIPLRKKRLEVVQKKRKGLDFSKAKKNPFAERLRGTAR